MTIFENLFYSAEPLQISTGSWIIDFYVTKSACAQKAQGRRSVLERLISERRGDVNL